MIVTVAWMIAAIVLGALAGGWPWGVVGGVALAATFFIAGRDKAPGSYWAPSEYEEPRMTFIHALQYSAITVGIGSFYLIIMILTGDEEPPFVGVAAVAIFPIAYYLWERWKYR